MASRKSNDTTSQTGVAFASGNPNAMTQRNINLSQQVNNKVATSTAYNGHGIEVWADGAVYDTVSGVFLFPFRDYDPNSLGRA